MANIAKLNQFPEDDKSAWLLGLLKKEIEIRYDKKITRLYNQAKFPKRKTLNDYIWREQINFSTPDSKQQLLNLSFIDKNGYTLSGIDTTSMPVFLYTKRTAAALMLYNQFTTKIM